MLVCGMMIVNVCMVYTPTIGEEQVRPQLNLLFSLFQMGQRGKVSGSSPY